MDYFAETAHVLSEMLLSEQDGVLLGFGVCGLHHDIGIGENY